MPTVIGIESRDIYFITEFKYEELKMLLEAMDRIVLNYDGAKPEEVKIKDYFTKEFYGFVKEIVEKYENAEPDNK
jgi:hypothetical protein